jgi:chitinase
MPMHGARRTGPGGSCGPGGARSGRRRLVAGAVAGFVALTGVGAAMASSGWAKSEPLQAALVKGSSWDSGYVAGYRITNASDESVTGWKLEFDLPEGQKLTGLWNGTVHNEGSHYTVTGESWNGAIPAGGKVSVGFEVSIPAQTATKADPTGCRINGTACNGVQGPETAPSATGPAPTPSGGAQAPTPSLTSTASQTPTVSQPVETSPTPTSTSLPTAPPSVAGTKVVGYFTEWGIYGRNYHVKNIETSGAADRLTHLVYAFGNVTGGKCAIGDSYADYDKAYTAADSVDGVADTWESDSLRGNFGQLRSLKKKHPNLKVLWSFGGWTWSRGFSEAAKDPTAFAASCRALVEDKRWADVFDGIDIDWEYPNACGVACDTSGRNAYSELMAALRKEFGGDLVTSAITADANPGGKLEAADYAGAARSVDWYMPMTYDYFGAWNPQGPTAPHSPLTSYKGIPQEGSSAERTIEALKKAGVSSNKLLLGAGFYGRGWTGVTQDAPGGTATGPAKGTYEAGIEDYKVLKQSCPATGTVGGTAYARCGTDWWSYDTPDTLKKKMAFAREQGLGGAFFWELSGDTPSGELIRAIGSGLS